MLILSALCTVLSFLIKTILYLFHNKHERTAKKFRSHHPHNYPHTKRPHLGSLLGRVNNMQSRIQSQSSVSTMTIICIFLRIHLLLNILLPTLCRKLKSSKRYVSKGTLCPIRDIIGRVQFWAVLIYKFSKQRATLLPNE